MINCLLCHSDLTDSYNNLNNLRINRNFDKYISNGELCIRCSNCENKDLFFEVINYVAGMNSLPILSSVWCIEKNSDYRIVFVRTNQRLILGKYNGIFYDPILDIPAPTQIDLEHMQKYIYKMKNLIAFV